MDTLWILTEERPKPSVIRQIIKIYEDDFAGRINFIDEDNIKIKPLFYNDRFLFAYIVEGIYLYGINQIVIKLVSGSSSFFDFLVFQQKRVPSELEPGNLLMAVEETKTSDDESRNSSTYQRATKFIFIDAFYPNVKRYMLYNDELEAREEKKPSDTNIFGTNMLLTLGVNMIGINTSQWFQGFHDIEELIQFKAAMRKPPAGDVPIQISRYGDRIEISGRLSKPANYGNIGHDPNIGALSLIARTLRRLGWNGRIVITHHGVSQCYIDRTSGKNKFLYICHMLNIELDGIRMPDPAALPKRYWHYERRSEKIASILLHMVAEYHGMRGIYQNHAGCERGYFKTKTNSLIALPKEDESGTKLLIPDLVLHDERTKTIILIEGKRLSTLNAGLKEIKYYDLIEHEYINRYYPDCSVYHGVSIFGGMLTELPDPGVILYLSQTGTVIINPNAPQCIIGAFREAAINATEHCSDYPFMERW